ncbi:MAG: hypothetical protein HY275_05955 [Gemmatimonadetes bacterium]|nr:hypothetical protein [Gemmatimonadota bacterium]
MSNQQNPGDLDGLIAKADAAAKVDDAATASAMQPRAARETPAWVAVVAVALAAATLYLERNELAGPVVDPVAERAAATSAAETTRGIIDEFRTRTGRLPSTIAEVGLIDWPVNYRLQDAGYELTVPLTTGDSLRVAGSVTP